MINVSRPMRKKHTQGIKNSGYIWLQQGKKKFFFLLGSMKLLKKRGGRGGKRFRMTALRSSSLCFKTVRHVVCTVEHEGKWQQFFRGTQHIWIEIPFRQGAYSFSVSDSLEGKKEVRSDSL